MNTSLEFLPADRQWRLALLLNERAPQRLPVSVAMTRSGAHAGDVARLAEIGWIEGQDYGSPIDLADLGNWPDHLVGITVKLTPAGIHWVTCSPFNLILFGIYAVSGYSQRGVSLFVVATAAGGAEMPVFGQLSKARLITLHYPDGEELDPDRGNPVIQRLSRETVRLTAHGVTIVSV